MLKLSKIACVLGFFALSASSKAVDVARDFDPRELSIVYNNQNPLHHDKLPEGFDAREVWLVESSGRTLFVERFNDETQALARGYYLENRFVLQTLAYNWAHGAQRRLRASAESPQRMLLEVIDEKSGDTIKHSSPSSDQVFSAEDLQLVSVGNPKNSLDAAPFLHGLPKSFDGLSLDVYGKGLLLHRDQFEGFAELFERKEVLRNVIVRALLDGSGRNNNLLKLQFREQDGHAHLQHPALN